MNNLKASPNTREVPCRGVLLCRWKQLDEGTLTSAWRATSAASVADPSPLDPTVSEFLEQSGAESYRPEGDFRGFLIARDIQGFGVWRDRMAIWLTRVRDAARVALLSTVIVGVCACGFHLVEQALTGPSEAVDVLSGS